MSIDSLDDVLVAIPARSLGNLPVPWSNLDRFMEIPQSKRHRVMISIQCLGHVLTHELMRGMAVVTDRDRMMTRLQPTIEMIIHHVAVRAGGRIVRQVRGPLSIDERESPHTGSDTSSNSEHQGDPQGPLIQAYSGEFHIETVLCTLFASGFYQNPRVEAILMFHE